MQSSEAKLTGEQKQAIGLLSIGTFLEYFDLMLYVHMTILVNELFFPKTDHHVASLLTAFTFCTTYLMRPVGAFIFGYIGDNIGRKHTVVITTLMMALTSIIIFFLPTYAQIGITASILVTLCRMVQGMSSMGELIGAILYLTEFIKPPKSYVAVGFVRTMPALGTFAALAIAAISINYGLNWRYAFLFGAVIAIVSYFARGSLRETPEFLDVRKKLATNKITIKSAKINKRVAIAYFLLECPWPIWVYVIYIHFGELLKNSLNYTASEVISHNLYISIACYIGSVITVYLSTKINPLQILQIRSLIFCVILPILIWQLEKNVTILNLTILQTFMIVFHPTSLGADPIIFKYFPVLKRFFATSMLLATAKVLMYSVTSVGIVLLTEYLGASYSLLFLVVPIIIGYFYGLNTFISLEKEGGNYNKKTFWSIVSLTPQLPLVRHIAQR